MVPSNHLKDIELVYMCKMVRNIILQGVNHSDTNLNQSFNREMRSLVPLRREYMIVS